MLPRGADKPLVLSKEYVEGVNKALGSKRDLWGEEVLARPEGPTYDNVKGYMVPLMHGDPDLTDSGTYYIPFGQPHEKQGASIEVALHVADGSQFYSNSPANNLFSEQYGNTWNVFVGAKGDERYGSSMARAKPPELADGYPILQTEYIDAQGVRYRQESFVARSSEISDAGGVREPRQLDSGDGRTWGVRGQADARQLRPLDAPARRHAQGPAPARPGGVRQPAYLGQAPAEHDISLLQFGCEVPGRDEGPRLARTAVRGGSERRQAGHGLPRPAQSSGAGGPHRGRRRELRESA